MIDTWNSSIVLEGGMDGLEGRRGGLVIILSFLYYKSRLVGVFKYRQRVYKCLLPRFRLLKSAIYVVYSQKADSRPLLRTT